MATLMLAFTLGVPVLLFCSACGLFGAGEPLAPLAACAPVPQDLEIDVLNVLLAGGDYEKALAERALERGQGMLDCAVQAALDELRSGKVAVSPERTAARERGESYLAKRRVK